MDNKLDIKKVAYEIYKEEDEINGELYACYDEFIQNQYRDIDTMKELFENMENKEELLKTYKEDIKRLMRTLNIRINFFWDDEDDICNFKLTVPNNVNEIEIVDLIEREHEYLCREDTEDIYGIQGRNPETLINYVCEKYNWEWNKFDFDIDLTFN